MTADRVYVKTAKGIEALKQRTSRLPENVLAVLRKVDGTRALSELMPDQRFAEDVPNSIKALIAGNFIVPAGCNVSGPTKPPPSTDPLTAAKHHITRALRDALGPEADRLIRKVEQAPDTAILRKIGLSHLRAIDHPGNKKQAERFRDGLVQLAVIRHDEARITSAFAQPAQKDIRPAQRTMCRLMSEALGPDADRFNLRIERTQTAEELRKLLAKYQDVVRSVAGNSKAETFIQRVSAALEAH